MSIKRNKRLSNETEREGNIFKVNCLWQGLVILAFEWLEGMFMLKNVYFQNETDLTKIR